MPAPPEPPELARLVDFAERSRTGDWSLRSALVRYAQSQPERVSQVLEQVRRIEFALHPHNKLLDREGPRLWADLADGPTPATGDDALVVEVLRAATELDQLGDVLAEWAVDRTGTHPDTDVDRVVTQVAGRLDELGVAREEQQPRPPGRGGERRR